MFNEQDWLEIDSLIEQGYISKRKHPTFDYYILNYTVKTQFDWFWNKYTMACRGLIVNSNNKIIARPFPKFFNDDQLDKMEWKIPKEPFEAFEKMDGSLGIMFHHYSTHFKKWTHHIATRGSFESDQANKGNKLLEGYAEVKWNPKYTYLFEIICIESKVVVNYDKEKLVLLAIIETNTGRELSHKEMIAHLSSCTIEIVKRYNINDWKLLLDNFDGDNREGFVIKFSSGFRVKIKYERYKELHRAICGLSARRLWEQLVEGKKRDDLIANIPDEFHTWTKNQLNILFFKFDIIEEYTLLIFHQILKELEPGYSKKDFAMKVINNPYSGILFLMENKRDYSPSIWKLIKPEGNITYASSEI